MPLLLFSRMGNLDSERLRGFAQGHSCLEAEPRKDNFLQNNLLRDGSSQLMDGARTQPQVSGLASIIWNPIKAERINKFQKGLEEFPRMIEPE